MSHYQHPEGIVESIHIGENTRIWAFTHILPGAIIGRDCNICDHTFIENRVVIGDRVTVKNGVQIWDGITVEDDVFIGPNVTFTNDTFPRSKQYPEQFATIIIQKGASIGANATILPNLTIGRYSMVGAGAVVTRNVPPYSVVTGNPARISGYAATSSSTTTSSISASEISEDGHDIGIKGVRLFKLPLIRDLRGSLSFAQYEEVLPFLPKRYFIVFDVPSKEVRGAHAHRSNQQFLVCVKGSCSIVVDDGQSRVEVQLDTPRMGLGIPPMVWGIQYKYSADAVLLVLASEEYNAEDYIRDYDEFIDILDKKQN